MLRKTPSPVATRNGLLLLASILLTFVALRVFGAGLAMALDEWVYLIATDGTNASYLLPVSLWGTVVVVGLACAYAGALVVWRRLTGSGKPLAEELD